MSKDEMVSSVQSPEFQEKLQQKLYALKGNNGRCIADGCGGRIVKSIRGIGPSGYILSMPHCEKCNRRYTFAGGDIPTVGHEQFQKLLSMRFDI